MVRTKAIYLRKKAEERKRQERARLERERERLEILHREQRRRDPRIEQVERIRLEEEWAKAQATMMPLPTVLAKPVNEKTTGPATVHKFTPPVKPMRVKKAVIFTRLGKKVPSHLVGKQVARRTGGRPIPRGD